MNKYYIVALIPARSQSKAIKDKNIKNYKGKPLLAHSIKHGLESNLIKEVFVTTDSSKYKKIAIRHGADIAIIRPKEISDDLSTDYGFFLHYINWLIKNNKRVPDIIVLLRPTYPSRKVEDIDKAIDIFIANFDQIDSLKSVVIADQSPFKMWSLKKNGLIKPVFTSKKNEELFNAPRQLLPDVYWQNGCIDIVKTSTVINMNSVTGERVYPYIMDSKEIYDIDTISDFIKSSENRSN
jgi:CMP-N,N'-diacetyllegionaminic acid synthase